MGEFNSTPYRFQAEDVERVHREFGGRALIAWSMGLGKSFGAMIYARKYLPTDGPIVVVCPKNVKENWRREFWKHCRIRAAVIDGNAQKAGHLPACTDGVYVVNFDRLGKVQPARHPRRALSWGNLLQEANPALVVIDEVQYAKNPKAKRTKAVRELVRKVPHLLGLGGTGGMENAPWELFSFLNMCRPDVFPSAWDFMRRYCKLRRRFGRWVPTGMENAEELHALMASTCMVRRLKEDVLTDLPPLTRAVVPVALPRHAMAVYGKAEEDYVAWLAAFDPKKARAAARAEELARLHGLLQLAGRLKYETGMVSDWLRDVMADGAKVLAFGRSRKLLADLTAEFGDAAVLVNGTVKEKDRVLRTDRFNNDKTCKLFVGHHDAGGVGWSCTSASDVAFVELPWNPGKVVQCTDRCRGIGRGTGRPVTAYFLIAGGTVEEWLAKLLEKKAGMIAEVLDGKKVNDFKIADELRKAILKRHEGQWPTRRSPTTGRTGRSRRPAARS